MGKRAKPKVKNVELPSTGAAPGAAASEEPDSKRCKTSSVTPSKKSGVTSQQEDQPEEFRGQAAGLASLAQPTVCALGPTVGEVEKEVSSPPKPAEKAAEEEATEKPKAQRTLKWGSYDAKTLRAKTEEISNDTAAACPPT
eukprot:COSAG01_NODE_8650_length_2707_cov_69.318252_1_plen_141_part_00